MPYEMVSVVDRGICVLDGGSDPRREGAVLRLNLGRPIVTNGDFATRLSHITVGSTCPKMYWTDCHHQIFRIGRHVMQPDVLVLPCAYRTLLR